MGACSVLTPLAPSTGLADVKEGEGPLLVPSGLEDELEVLELNSGRDAEIIPRGGSWLERAPYRQHRAARQQLHEGRHRVS